MLRLRQALARLWASFSFVGLAVATLFFAASLTPTLLPRNSVVQGALSGFAIAVGYGVGVGCVWLWLYLEIPKPSDKVQRVSKWITTFAVSAVVITFLWRETVWQNSIRELMEMQPVAPAYPWRLALIALVTSLLLIVTARGLGSLWRWINHWIKRVVPRRVSIFISSIVLVVGVLLLVNNVIARLALNVADRIFLQLDQSVEENVAMPQYDGASGSVESLIEWDTIGRFGKQFITAGPTMEGIGEFWGRDDR